MKELLQAVWSSIRNTVANGVVTAVNDAGGAKTVNVTTAEGVNRADVEVADVWGLAAVPPADGIITRVFKIGDDPANMVALPLSNPSARMGGLLAGESALYGADGSRVHIRKGGVVEIWAGASLTTKTKAIVVNTQTKVLTVPEGYTINGPVTINGAVTVTGDMIVGGRITQL